MALNPRGLLFMLRRLLQLPLFLPCRASLGRHSTICILLPLRIHRWRFLPSPLSGFRRTLPFLLFNVPADFRVTRLVAVIPAAYRMLLLYPLRIPVP